MKRFRLAFAAAFALGLGLSGGVSAVETDPECMGLCLDLRNDCLGDAAEFGLPTRPCILQYRECTAGCVI